MPFERGELRPEAEAASIIVAGRVAAGPSADQVVLHPETYYKGAAEGRDFVLTRPEEGECPPADLQPGTRVFAFLRSDDNQLAWPDASRAFVIEDGMATNEGPEPWSLPEEELAEQVRALTGQASVPAGPGDDGPTIDWVGTVLPVSVALIIVFGIGLAMMRVWHRIDPS